MNALVTHEERDHRQVQAYRWSSGHLRNQRARLRVLIYTMEHDQNIHPQPWQVLSLKRMLNDIEKRLDVIGTAGAADMRVRRGYDQQPSVS